MITQLTFSNPTISVSTLAEDASQFLADFQSNDQATVLDSILLAILRRDTRKVITQLFCFLYLEVQEHVVNVYIFFSFNR